MASSSRPQRIYHVFLSFRGEDIRNNFLGHLYRALDQKGIYTYIDSEEIGKGKQIVPMLMEAIEESHIAIIIFSEDYASSWWCLEELAKIMDCKEERDLMVFPVFYKVEPKEVRTPREKFREAILKHESKFGKDSEEVKRWKKALSDAGNLFGWHLKDGDESELIQRIVREISSHLDRTLVHAAKHLVGINSRVVKLKSMLNLESDNEVLMVGLWGQGGIGKTTLAKAIYNDIFNQFKNSCFLADVRQASKDCKDLVTLQEKLLYEILGLKERLVVSNVDRGINLVRDRLHHKKVLLILDDVDDLRQLNALAGEDKWFGNGSRIIITTRNKHLLTGHGIDLNHVYEVKELDDGASLELLSKHAFFTHQNLKIRTDLMASVLHHARGLPLALEVLGSFLRGRGEHEWESTLNKLSRIPNKTINDVLKISYDGLEENEREIFLHIACFFKGWDREYTKKILDSCDLEAAIGLSILIERSLISIEHHIDYRVEYRIKDGIGYRIEHRIENKILQVHDLIQLMGMDIVNQECRDDPRKRSRLWLYDDVLSVLSCDMGYCAVKAIVFKSPEPMEICIDPKAFSKLRRLRLLIMRNVHNSFQDPIHLSNDLRWFELDGWNLTFSYGPKKLVGFNMSGNNFTTVAKQFKDFQNLKCLNLNNCDCLVCMPDLSCTPNLEELVVCNCKNMVEVHQSIGYHDRLQVLTLVGCSELCVFPSVLRSKTLRHLDLEDCKKLERFPDVPCKLESLKLLSLRGTAIKELPMSIENFVSLERMYLCNCKNLVNLPSSIYNLQNIEKLEVWNCTTLMGFPKYENSNDSSMKTGLSSLQYLNLQGCKMSEVKFLENLSCFPFLRHLDLSGNNITSLPTSINKRDHLSVLRVADCCQLQEISQLPPFLNYFWASNCESLQKTGEFISSHEFARRGLTMVHNSAPSPGGHDYSIYLPGAKLPEWFLPIEEGFVSFRASKDLYDKFLGLALCVVLDNGGRKEPLPYYIQPYVNGQRQNDIEWHLNSVDSDHIWLQLYPPSKMLGVIDFSQIDESYIQFKLTISGGNVKKWGFRIICKQLDDSLKAEIQDKQLINLAFLYEVGHESADLEVKSSLMPEVSLIETDLQKDLQDCQKSTKKHSQIGSKRKHEFNLPQGKRTKMMLTFNSTDGDENEMRMIDLLKNLHL